MARIHSGKVPSPKPSAKSSISVASMISAIRHRGLPWIEQHAADSIIIPRPNFDAMKSQAASDGIEITRSPLQGRRISSRERPGGIQFINARWPSEKLESKLMPMIACTIQGTADLRLNDYTLHCPEGNFIFIPAGFAHPDGSTPHFHGDPASERSCDILWFFPMGDVLRTWICRSENGKHSSLPSIYFDQKNLCTYLAALFEHLEDRSDTLGKVRQGLLIALLASVVNEIEAGRFFRWLPQTVDLTSEEEDDPIKRAHIYIRQYMNERLTLERVARYSFMSRSQFARKFSEQTGETFCQFLTRCRLEEAKLRLTNTTAEVARIGRHVGLQPRQFNHLFRLHIGLTPGDYRRQHRNESAT